MNNAHVFKDEVAVETLQGEQIIVELSQRYHVHPDYIRELKKRLLEQIEDVLQQ